MSYFVYVIFSEKANKKYIGQTENIDIRLKQHNDGNLGTYTKNKGPWILIYSEEFKNRTEAILRERYLKTGAGRDYIKTITGK